VEQELWQKVEELFHAVLERTPDARRTFLDGNCCVNTDLRREVELLLAKEAQARSFLEVSALADITATLTATESLTRPPGRSLSNRGSVGRRWHGRGLSGER
jgi:hypothetical protein